MALRLALSVLVLSLALLVHGLPDYDAEFASWMTKHSKSYSPTEFITRFANFKSTYDFIKTHNAGGHSFQVGLNEVSDLTPQEFAAKYLTLKTPVHTGTYAAPVVATSGTSTRQAEAPAEAPAQQRSSRALPTSIDWQTKGAVTSVKNQGTCGCCWAFSATAAIEAINQINGSKLTDFSNQQVLDCTGATSYGSNSTCDGGYFSMALNTVATSGIQNLTTYAAYNQSRYPSCRYNPAKKAGSVRAVSYPLQNSELGLATQLQIQPIVVSFDASDPAFQSYSKGIYTSTTCSSVKTNHAMLLIGYGVNTTTGAQWWRIKNQWGTTWGEAGFLRVARGSNMCGVASFSAYPTLVVPPKIFYAFNDSFVNGWTFSTSGSVTSVNQTSTTAVKGTSLSANVMPNGLLVASLPQGSLTYRYFYYSIRAVASAKVQVYVYYGGGAYSWTSFSLTAGKWYSNLFDLSSPQSISQIVFNNTGTGTTATTYFIDELYFQNPKMRRTALAQFVRPLVQRRFMSRSPSLETQSHNSRYLFAIFPAIAFGLGTWQLYRLQWKTGLIEQAREAAAKPALEIPPNPSASDFDGLKYRKLDFGGKFLNAQSMPVGPRMSDNVIGSYVITPFLLSQGGRILVNRGWVAKTELDAFLANKSEETARVGGYLTDHSKERPNFVPETDLQKNLWFWADVETMARLTNSVPVLINSIQESTESGVKPFEMKVDDMFYNKHLTYLITWYSLSAALTLLCFKFVRQPKKAFSRLPS